MYFEYQINMYLTAISWDWYSSLFVHIVHASKHTYIYKINIMIKVINTLQTWQRCKQYKQVNYNRYLQNRLSVFLSLFSNLLTYFAHNTLGISKSKCFRISMLLVLNSFIKSDLWQSLRIAIVTWLWGKLLDRTLRLEYIYWLITVPSLPHLLRDQLFNKLH